MEIRLCGPVEVWRDGRQVSLGGPKVRALLVLLALRANEAVSRDALIDGLWGERPPASANHTVEDYVSRLRKALGPDRIETRPPGYRLIVELDELDLERFERLLARARDEPSVALEHLEAAARIWRGPALADLLFEPVGEHARELEERRLVATEERIEAALARGRDVPELEQLVREHPYRERLLAQLMLALYRRGRQPEALAAFQAARQRFAVELGLDLSPQTRELERRILEHDRALGRPPAARATRRRPRGALRAVGVATALAVAGATLIVGLGGARGEPRLREIPWSGAAAAMTVVGGAVWVADPDAGTVTRLDSDTATPAQRVTVGGSPGAIASAGRALWVAGRPGTSVARIDRTTETVTQTVRLGGATASALAADARGLWIGDVTNSRLLQLDPASGAIRRAIDLDIRPTAITSAQGAIWVADYDAHAVAEVDVETGRTVATIGVGNGPAALIAAAGAIWVANTLDSTVSRIDPRRGTVAATIPVASAPTALVAAEQSIWVAGGYARAVAEIDPRRNAVVRNVPVHGRPTALAAVDGALWVATQPQPDRRGGRLVLLSTLAPSMDPVDQFISPLQTIGLTSDPLLTFNHVGGPDGLRLVPDLAVSLPTPTGSGRTYTFRLRPGMRYSDGRSVRATDVRRGIVRAFRLSSVNADVIKGIAGAAACPTRCDLNRGVIADDDAGTVTFHLERPDPQFLPKLASSGLSIPVPPGTPLHRRLTTTPIPGTGPYRVASIDRHTIRYVRNPGFREWSHAAQPAGNPDEIVMRIGLNAAREVDEIVAGRADWMVDPVPSDKLPAVKARFSSQLHTHPGTDTEFLQFNTTAPPFDDARVRKALNLAIDRDLMVELLGGPDVAEPTCQLIPPGVIGYRRYCPYARNIARARRLVATSGTRGAPVTVWGWKDDAYAPVRLVEHTAAMLRELGYRTRVKLVTHDWLANQPDSRMRAIQIITLGWNDITAGGFFGPWLSCAGAGNHGWFCDRALDRDMARATALEAIRPQDGARAWARIDREITDRAALVPHVNLRQIDFASARLRGYQHHPFLGLIADQAWLR